MLKNERKSNGWANDLFGQLRHSPTSGGVYLSQICAAVFAD
ncbi:MAG: hypothetical protein ACI4IJ_00030 [Acutalibacteraceae bacterium]